ncbi:UvrD-helicase domain-containing protein, partial [Candidatus Saccharibacteria bacterium]|nr:UvrD-helicase domain-containing protein [Candidatus Saccharibacteria bacterium]
FWIGTFHSTCAKILRRDGAAIGIPPSFVIYDESDQKKLIKDLMEKLYLHQERFSPTSVVAAIS